MRNACEIRIRFHQRLEILGLPGASRTVFPSRVHQKKSKNTRTTNLTAPCGQASTKRSIVITKLHESNFVSEAKSHESTDYFSVRGGPEYELERFVSVFDRTRVCSSRSLNTSSVRLSLREMNTFVHIHFNDETFNKSVALALRFSLASEPGFDFHFTLPLPRDFCSIARSKFYVPFQLSFLRCARRVSSSVPRKRRLIGECPFTHSAPERLFTRVYSYVLHQAPFL